MLAVLGNLMLTPSPWTPKLSAKRIQRDKVCSARVRERERESCKSAILHMHCSYLPWFFVSWFSFSVSLSTSEQNYCRTLTSAAWIISLALILSRCQSESFVCAYAVGLWFGSVQLIAIPGASWWCDCEELRPFDPH